MAGQIPDPMPCEVYCHTLTDGSILDPELRAAGYHTLTLFGMHTPARPVHGRSRQARESGRKMRRCAPCRRCLPSRWSPASPSTAAASHASR